MSTIFQSGARAGAVLGFDFLAPLFFFFVMLRFVAVFMLLLAPWFATENCKKHSSPAWHDS
jgi:hypothetical protein